MDLRLRPLTTDDIAAWARLLAAAELVDRTGEHYNEADIAEEMADPNVEIGKDIVGAFDDDDLVGYFKVMSRGRSEDHHDLRLEGSVHPGRRGQGIGTTLVAAMLDRAEEVRHEKNPSLPAKLAVTGLSTNAEQESLLAAFGFAPERWNFMMRVDLDEIPAPEPLPPGYVLKQYDPSIARAMHEAHNTAFVDHPNFTSWTDSMWKQWVTGSRNFRPDVSYLVVLEDDPGQIAAYVQSNEYNAYFEASGKREAYVAKVGTLREHRGKGIAGTLLRHCLAAYREAGYDEAALDVDSDNPTGALGVYERVGFKVESKWSNYSKVTPAST
jgi:mycothiol synthase